jgi:hypothetical protein
MMNNLFDSKRFLLLLKKTILERPTQLIGFTVLMLCVSFFTYLFFRSMGGYEEGQNVSFMLGFAGGGCFLGTLIFNYFNSNAKGASYLLLPASQFEKWLVAILITGVFYTVVFLLFFRMIDTIFVDMQQAKLDPKSIYYYELKERVRVLPYDGFVFRLTLMMYLNFAGATMLGALFFNKASFIKVALIFFSLLFIFFFLNMIIAKMMMSGVQNSFPYLWIWVRINDSDGRVEIPENILNVWKVCAFIIVPVTLWLLSLIRLKEKQF